MKRIIAVQFTRKRKRVTDYRKRLKLMLSGKERLVVRKTSSQLIIQFAKLDPRGDKVVVTANSGQLKKYGWELGKKNIPAAYLTGILAGKIAQEKGVKEAVLDVGTAKPESRGRVYAALKGVIDSGVKVPASEKAFPPEERIAGKHLQRENAEQSISVVKAKITGGKNE